MAKYHFLSFLVCNQAYKIGFFSSYGDSPLKTVAG